MNIKAIDKFKVRCSSLYKIMANATRGKRLTDNQLQTLESLEKRIKDNIKPLTKKQLEILEDYRIRKDFRPEYDLSTGAKTYIASEVKQIFYGYKPAILDVPKIQKGLLNEEENISLYNNVFFTNFSKNKTRLSNNGITGEWDASNKNTTLDIKSAWSWDSFCALESELHTHCEKSGYFTQGRGYMHLNETSIFKVAHCMSNTPKDLLNTYQEDQSCHIVSDDVPLEQRITVVSIERDLEKEEEILYKVKEAKRYAIYYYSQLAKKNY